MKPGTVIKGACPIMILIIAHPPHATPAFNMHSFLLFSDGQLISSSSFPVQFILLR